jgi:prepilin-type N-terminal cleavage/methylation domain-containing protein
MYADNYLVWGFREKLALARRDERGFTLPEVLTVIAILGILIAIAVIVWLGILERRRVDAATNQLVADLRLAHTSATNQLTDWRVVLDPERTDADVPDYYLVKLQAPYPAASPVAVEVIPRTFPDNVKVVNIAGTLDTGTGWVISPSVVDQTRTLEFNTNGTMKFYQAVSGSTCVTVDGDPQNRVIVTAATSRVKVEAGAC